MGVLSASVSLAILGPDHEVYWTTSVRDVERWEARLLDNQFDGWLWRPMGCRIAFDAVGDRSVVTCFFSCRGQFLTSVLSEASKLSMRHSPWSADYETAMRVHRRFVRRYLRNGGPS